jgi:hypothetical protein
MSRRLAEMVEETMDTGSRSDRKLMQHVGFSEELKKQLEERIAQSTFNSENQQALSKANLPVSVKMPLGGRGGSLTISVLGRKRHTRPGRGTAMDGQRVSPRLCASNARR